MACSKYTLTNTGSTIVNFSYRRCDDSFFDYQVELLPNQVKNIWVINGTYTVASSFRNSILFLDEGPFPPISATNTPTPSNSPTPTPSVTASQTPTVTNTQTVTPTNTGTLPSTPTPTPNNVFAVYSGSTSDESCGQYYSTVVLYGNNSQFDLSSQFSNISSFPPSVGMTGFIQNSGFVFELDADGFVVGFGTLCATLTPTPTNSSTPTVTPTNSSTPTVTPTNSSTPTVTPTNSSTPTVTPTNSSTPTVTPTNTSSPTPTFGYYTYSLGTGATANDACVDFSGSPNTIYGTVSGGAGPNAGEFLYTTPGNPPTNVVPNGYYSNGTAVFEVTGGLGQITSVDPSGC